MRSAIAIISYRRFHSLKTMMEGINRHCPFYKAAIFEDCGQRDNTADELQRGRKPRPRPDLFATEYVSGETPDPSTLWPNVEVFMGDCNLGVAGNSNRALRWFMESGCDHLCLCNDDLHVEGDFVKYYGKGHTDLGVGLFCFCDFAGETYRWTTYPWRGYKVKLLPRFTGIMMSITRPLVEKVGYFDAVFGKFGEEHCDYTIRCRLAGGVQLEGQDMNCLDLEHALLRHQEVETSVVGVARKRADEEANLIMQHCSAQYKCRHYHRPFLLRMPRTVAGFSGGGMDPAQLMQCGYALVSDPLSI